MRKMKEGRVWGVWWAWRRKMKSKEELQAARQQRSRKSVLHEE